MTRLAKGTMLMLFLAALGLLSSIHLLAGQEQRVKGVGPALQVARIKTEPVRVSPELLSLVAKKRTLDPALLQRMVSYRRNIPMLKLKTGKLVALEPLRAETMPNKQEKDKALQIAPNLQKYSAYINSKYIWIGKIIVTRYVPPTVDHRSCQTSIRYQGDRGTCTAFASIGGLEGFDNCTKHTVYDLSEEHAYHLFMQHFSSSCPLDTGIQTWQAAAILTDHHVCSEADQPYTVLLASLPPNDATHISAACAAHAIYGYVTTQTLFGNAYGGGTWVNANNTNYLESILASGSDIVYGLKVAGTDWGDGTAESGVIDVQQVGGAPAPAYAGHAMLLVGYDRPNQYFIFKNSWSTAHGHAGYFYVSYNYLQTYGKYGFYITATTP